MMVSHTAVNAALLIVASLVAVVSAVEGTFGRGEWHVSLGERVALIGCCLWGVARTGF